MAKRSFTQEQANDTLPLVRHIVADLLEQGQALQDANTNASDQAEIDRLEAEITELVTELESLGCFFKNWRNEFGVVTFPAVIADEEVLLCWRSDEENVKFYHAYDGDYTTRKRLP